MQTAMRCVRVGQEIVFFFLLLGAFGLLAAGCAPGDVESQAGGGLPTGDGGVLPEAGGEQPNPGGDQPLDGVDNPPDGGIVDNPPDGGIVVDNPPAEGEGDNAPEGDGNVVPLGPIFTDVVFYDVYQPQVNLPTPPGVIRLNNSLNARKLSDPELSKLGADLVLNVIIKAACDNYDRIGSFHLALVPKGSETYSPADVPRIEVARFITPFMDKNKQPDQVRYRFNVGKLAQILRDPALHALYDIWAELEVGGVSSAAQQQVEGCKGRFDVFSASAEFVSSSNSIPEGKPFLLPLNFMKNLNNYEAGASDELTKSVRTIPFQLTEPITDAHFYLITSNHGSNQGGEEYNRRTHYIYLDGKLIAEYKPGGASCEPYRTYNTMSNGIYGPFPKLPFMWESWSNWCPGQSIPIRDLTIGTLPAGHHTFKISVPDAVFAGAQGNIAVSVYLQGTI